MRACRSYLSLMARSTLYKELALFVVMAVVELALFIPKMEKQFSGVVAIGEAGLDTLAESPMDLQKEVFLAQANLAEETHKPLIIHCVKAWADLIACKKAVKPEMPWIIHGFRGNGELASQLVRLGFYLSFGDRFNPSALRAAWPDFLFLETDDKSIDIRRVYQNVAEALDIPEEKLRIQIAKNVSIFHLNG